MLGVWRLAGDADGNVGDDVTKAGDRRHRGRYNAAGSEARSPGLNHSTLQHWLVPDRQLPPWHHTHLDRQRLVIGTNDPSGRNHAEHVAHRLWTARRRRKRQPAATVSTSNSHLVNNFGSHWSPDTPYICNGLGHVPSPKLPLLRGVQAPT